MAAPEWAKLDDLSRDIADAQVRLKGAKSARRLELAAAIEREIDEMDERRSHLFGQIADNLAGEPSGSTGAVRAAAPSIYRAMHLSGATVITRSPRNVIGNQWLTLRGSN